MSHDLSLAKSHAFHLSRDLMVLVSVFEVDGEYGVLPSRGYPRIPSLGGSLSRFAVLAAACEPAPAREASPPRSSWLSRPAIIGGALAAFALRG